MHPALATLAAIAALAAVVYLLVQVSRARRTETLHCTGKDVDCEVQFECVTDVFGGPGEAVDVTRCSALDDPNHVTCDKACIHMRGPTPVAA